MAAAHAVPRRGPAGAPLRRAAAPGGPRAEGERVGRPGSAARAGGAAIREGRRGLQMVFRSPFSAWLREHAVAFGVFVTGSSQPRIYASGEVSWFWLFMVVLAQQLFSFRLVSSVGTSIQQLGSMQ